MRLAITSIAFALLAPLAVAQEPSGVRFDTPHMIPRDYGYPAKGGPVNATVVADSLPYRTCPKRSCEASGEFVKGTNLTLECYTRTDTDTIQGDKGWAKIASDCGKGNWVAMANGRLVSWEGLIYAC